MPAGRAQLPRSDKDTTDLRAREQEWKRSRGAISCAECRRCVCPSPPPPPPFQLFWHPRFISALRVSFLLNLGADADVCGLANVNAG